MLSRQLQPVLWSSAHRSRGCMLTVSSGIKGQESRSRSVIRRGSSSLKRWCRLKFARFGTRKGYSSSHRRCPQMGSACVTRRQIS